MNDQYVNQHPYSLLYCNDNNSLKMQKLAKFIAINHTRKVLFQSHNVFFLNHSKQNFAILAKNLQRSCSLSGELFQQSKYRESLQILEDFRKQYEEYVGGDDYKQTLALQYANTILINSGVMYDLLGQYAQSFEMFKTSLPILIHYRGQNSEQVGWCYQLLGNVSMRVYSFEQSLLLCQKAEQIFQKIGKDQGDRYEKILINMGTNLWQLKRMDEALQVLNRGLRLCDSSNPSMNYSSFIMSIGSILSQMGQYEDALEHEIKGVEYIRKLKGTRPLHNIGLTLFNLGRYEESLQKFEEALSIYSKFTGMEEHVAAQIKKGIASAKAKIQEQRKRK